MARAFLGVDRVVKGAVCDASSVLSSLSAIGGLDLFYANRQRHMGVVESYVNL